MDEDEEEDDELETGTQMPPEHVRPVGHVCVPSQGIQMPFEQIWLFGHNGPVHPEDEEDEEGVLLTTTDDELEEELELGIHAPLD